MAPFLTINAEGIKRLQALASLPEPQFQQLAHTLQTRGTTFAGRGEIWEFAHAQAPDNAESVAFSLEAVLPLLLDEENERFSAEELADAVVAAMQRHVKGKELTVEDGETVRARLLRLLSDTATRVRMKSLSLVYERPTVLKNARIITDLRPVFGSGKPLSIDAASVIHTLVLNCRENSQTKKMHVALDAKDLGELKLAIERALEKDAALTELASKAGVMGIQIK